MPPNVLRAADILLATNAILFICGWAYAIYFFIWVGARPFRSAVEIVLCIGLPPFAAILFYASLELKPRTRIRLAMGSMSAFASLYLGEAFLGLALPIVAGRPLTTWVDGASQERKTEIARLAARHGVKFDTRDRIEVLLEARSHGLDAVPAIYPSALLEPQPGESLISKIRIGKTEILPLGGISNKISVLCNELGDYVSYQSDEHGFNNAMGTWKSPRLDLAVVGDSFAHGFCVPPKEHFVTLLRQNYPATLNLGMGGNGPLFELATLKEFLPPFRPKIVLWAYFEKNDLSDMRREARSPLLLHYLRHAFRQELTGKQAEIDNALLEHIEKEKLAALRKLHERRSDRHAQALMEFAKLTKLRSGIERITGGDAYKAETGEVKDEALLALFRSILLQAKINVQSWGGSLIFVYFPQWERYDAAMPHDLYRTEVLEIVASLEIPMIDLHEPLQSHSDPLSLFPFRLSGHYNPEGNRLVAEAIMNRLHP